MKKRIWIIVLVCFMMLLSGCNSRWKLPNNFAKTDDPDKFTQSSIEKYMEDAGPYLQGLNVSEITCSAYIDESYYVYFNQGSLARLSVYEYGKFTKLSPIPEENRQIAFETLDEADTVLKSVQQCLANGLYTDVHNDPNNTAPNMIYLTITEEGMKLFPKDDIIKSITIQIFNDTAWEGAQDVIYVQNKYLKPAGMSVSIWFGSLHRNIFDFDILIPD